MYSTGNPGPVGEGEGVEVGLGVVVGEDDGLGDTVGDGNTDARM